MSFLHWPAEKTGPGKRSQYIRRRLALDLLGEFGRAFPEITYELLWESLTVNAQAWRLGSARYVRIYGGLVRHSAVTRSGLALVIAHETGHHLGGPPYDSAMPWMTSQGQADYWAARNAMPLIFGTKSRKAILLGAKEIVTLSEDIMGIYEDDEPDLPAMCRYKIFCAAAAGREMPSCALDEFAQL